jgi:hypothetical protein
LAAFFLGGAFLLLFEAALPLAFAGAGFGFSPFAFAF